MHLFNCFPRIQSLRDLGIISPRQLPVESFLHDAWFFGCLGDFWLTLHAVVPLPFFLSLPLSPPPHNPLYQNVSECINCPRQNAKSSRILPTVGLLWQSKLLILDDHVLLPGKHYYSNLTKGDGKHGFKDQVA